jgi:hypothetical protein
LIFRRRDLISGAAPEFFGLIMTESILLTIAGSALEETREDDLVAAYFSRAVDTHQVIIPYKK